MIPKKLPGLNNGKNRDWGIRDQGFELNNEKKIAGNR